MAAHGRGRWPEVVGGHRQPAKLPKYNPSPSHSQPGRIEHRGLWGGLGVVLVASHGGGGDGGAGGGSW